MYVYKNHLDIWPNLSITFSVQKMQINSRDHVHDICSAYSPLQRPLPYFTFSTLN